MRLKTTGGRSRSSSAASRRAGLRASAGGSLISCRRLGRRCTRRAIAPRDLNTSAAPGDMRATLLPRPVRSAQMMHTSPTRQRVNPRENQRCTRWRVGLVCDLLPGRGNKATGRDCYSRGPPASAGRGPGGHPASTGSPTPTARRRARSGSVRDRPASDRRCRPAAHPPSRRSPRRHGAIVGPRIPAGFRRLTAPHGSLGEDPRRLAPA